MSSFDYDIAIIGGGAAGLTITAGAVLPYPTLAAINKRVAGSYLSPKIISDRIKKGLKLFFQLKGPVDPPCSQI